MADTNELVEEEKRRGIIDAFGQKIINYGHSMVEARRNKTTSLKGSEN